MKHLYLPLIFLLIFSCKNEEKPTVTGLTTKLLVVGKDTESMKFTRILNPVAEVDTKRYRDVPDSIFSKKEYYSFNLGGNFGNLTITRWESFGSQRHSYFVDNYNLIRIECYFALCESSPGQITVSNSPSGDSVLVLSEESKLKNFPNITEQVPTTNYFPIPFSYGDSITVSSSDPRWRSRSRSNFAEAHKGFSFYYSFRHQLEVGISNSTEKGVRILDYHYPAWQGLKEKYMIFNIESNNDSNPVIANLKLAWLKVSVSNEGKLTIHEVAYEE